MNLVSVSHGFGQISFHMVFCPKYRYGILRGKIKSSCERIFREIAAMYGFTIYELEVHIDHVHLFVGFKPNVSVSQVVRLFKGISARRMFQEFPELRRRYWKGHFWSRGKFYRSVGNVTADTIQHYISKSSGDWSRVLPEEDVQPPQTGAQTSLFDYS